MQLLLITNEAKLAREADLAGIERIMIDLEGQQKATRQAGKNLFLSTHTLADVPLIKASLVKANLLVRVNSIHAQSRQEIDQVIARGADCVMLPYFNQQMEVDRFSEFVGDRAKKIMLVETQQSLQLLEHLIERSDIDEIHIGLNDLCLSMGYRSIFQPLYTGLIADCCQLLQQSGKPYGFGGIACLSDNHLPISPDWILGEQIRLGCTRGWLGRSFRDALVAEMIGSPLIQELGLLRKRIRHWQWASSEVFAQNTQLLQQAILKWEIDSLAPQLIEEA